LANMGSFLYGNKEILLRDDRARPAGRNDEVSDPTC
jgi:hypothetical protein